MAIFNSYVSLPEGISKNRRGQSNMMAQSVGHFVYTMNIDGLLGIPKDIEPHVIPTEKG